MFIFRVVLIGTLSFAGLLSLLLFISYAIAGNDFVLTRLLVALGGMVYLGFIATLTYQFHAYKTAMPMFLLFYVGIAAASTWSWGLNSVFAVLLWSLVIVLGGIIIRARYALYMATLATAVLIWTQIAINHGHQITFANMPPTDVGEALGYSVIFYVIALLCWLYGNQMERSLYKAERAEFILQGQKNNLEAIVKKRTEALESKRLEEMAQLYRFTQVGTLGTGLLHDMANYLTSLTLDIENLHDKNNSETLKRASNTIKYIDTMVDTVRDHLQGESREKPFNSADAIDTVIQTLLSKAHHAHVALDWKKPSSTGEFKAYGDVIRFNQIITTLVCNAIEAYQEKDTDKNVLITIKKDGANAVINVTDKGKGISDTKRKQIFEPFNSTKKQGMGIGLFLAKQTVESSFKGSIQLDPETDRTSFTITVPLHS
jgi:signal transduction histidine kinase